MYTFIYVKLRYIAEQEVAFLEFHIQFLEKFCERHIFSLFTFPLITCPVFIVLEWDFHHLNAEFLTLF